MMSCYPAFTAIVTFDDGYPKVKVSLSTEGGVWKVDNVEDESSAALVE
jgi:hypothetical protein